MKQSVIIKGNISKGAKGVTVILDPQEPFKELKKHVAEKFRELSDFLKQSRMAVAFEGRELTLPQQQELLDVITENSEIEILYLMEENPQKERAYEQQIAAALQAEQQKTAENMFYKGTLRSGQVVESESSVVIIGDVNPGGKVVSGGNIIILGALKGVACAGITGNRQAFVVALEMKPTQIRIDNIVAKCGDVPAPKSRIRKKKTVDETPKIAVLREDNIFIENLDRETLSSLDLS
ncbi:MAG: septum site-determining protein MinC [Lachnospiraceae bacterium]|nr:septum site-determining protein MinC [Lachnospiraceae bacterium]